MTKVVVIDDEDAICRALRINLAARDYDVTTAADGASGLATVARERPDAVILDLGLPDMDGTDVITGVRWVIERATLQARVASMAPSE